MNFLLSLSASSGLMSARPWVISSCRGSCPCRPIACSPERQAASSRSFPCRKDHQAVFAVRSHLGERSLPRLRAFWMALGSEVSRLRMTILRRLAGVVIAS
jgi:hypothetical protein